MLISSDEELLYKAASTGKSILEPLGTALTLVSRSILTFSSEVQIHVQLDVSRMGLLGKRRLLEVLREIGFRFDPKISVLLSSSSSGLNPIYGKGPFLGASKSENWRVGGTCVISFSCCFCLFLSSYCVNNT